MKMEEICFFRTIFVPDGLVSVWRVKIALLFGLIWYDIYIYIYLTAVGLTPSGSGTVHIYTQNNTGYRERNLHNNQKIKNEVTKWRVDRVWYGTVVLEV
jgi:hypothetical protein